LQKRAIIFNQMATFWLLAAIPSDVCETLPVVAAMQANMHIIIIRVMNIFYLVNSNYAYKLTNLCLKW